MKPFNTFRRLGFVTATALALAACGENSFFGANIPPPLPGERISILANQRSIEADAGAATTEIVLPAPTVNPDWPQTGGYANHAMHHIAVGDSLQRAWTTKIGAGTDDEVRLNAQPIMAAGRVYTLDSETVAAAFDAKTGEKVWETELSPEDEEDDEHVSGGLAFEDGRVFVTTGFSEVIALDSATGKILWRKNFSAPFRSAPTVRGNRIFAITITNKLFAINALTGENLWSHSGAEEATSLLGGSSPAIDNGIVVVPYSSGELFALSTDTGRELWTDSLSAPRRSNLSSRLSAIRGRPVIDRGLVFAVSNSGLMAAINLRTGRRVWDREIGGIESPWVAGNFLFVLTNSSELVAVSRTDGRIHWVQALPNFEDPEDKEGRIFWTGPILVNDRLLVANSVGEAFSVSPYTGKILGKEEMPDGVSIAPIVAAGSVYILSNNAELVAYR
ncbi:MAG: PQQ-binding-like beta-propeller repeat protein [Proteobacteria bacterium]|nr:PQQ-binding-like beta-propeller repeat protein [Pseudomonadota bacterium]